MGSCSDYSTLKFPRNEAIRNYPRCLQLLQVRIIYANYAYRFQDTLNNFQVRAQSTTPKSLATTVNYSSSMLHLVISRIICSDNNNKWMIITTHPISNFQGSVYTLQSRKQNSPSITKVSPVSPYRREFSGSNTNFLSLAE